MSAERTHAYSLRSSFAARERLAPLSYLDVSVIGTLHGYIDGDFKGREQAETDLYEAYHGRPAQVMVLDAIMPLESQNGHELIMKTLQSPIQATPSFYEWGVNYAIENSSAIISADPMSDNKDYFAVADAEFNNAVKALTAAYPPHPVADITFPGALVFASALYEKRSMNRRQFLGVMSMIPFSGNVQEQPLPSPDDIDIVNAILDHPGEITDADRANLSMERFATLIKEYFPYSVVLRNAIIADVLAAYNDTLQAAGGKKELGAVMMGSYHLAVPTEVSITYLLNHSDERQELIASLLDGMFSDIGDKLFDTDDVTVDPENIRNTLRTFAKKYRIDSLGDVTCESLISPATELWLS